MNNNRVFLVTSGSGEDGDEWFVHSIHSTSEFAENAKNYYNRERKNLDGTTYHYDAVVEEWPIDEFDLIDESSE